MSENPFDYQSILDEEDEETLKMIQLQKDQKMWEGSGPFGHDYSDGCHVFEVQGVVVPGPDFDEEFYSFHPDAELDYETHDFGVVVSFLSESWLRDGARDWLEDRAFRYGARVTAVQANLPKDPCGDCYESDPLEIRLPEKSYYYATRTFPARFPFDCTYEECSARHPSTRVYKGSPAALFPVGDWPDGTKEAMHADCAAAYEAWWLGRFRSLAADDLASIRASHEKGLAGNTSVILGRV